MSEELLLRLFENAGVSSQKVTADDPVTKYDLFQMGFSGTPDAKENRKKLLQSLDLPEFLSTNSLLSYINSSMTREEFIKLCHEL